MLIVSLNCNGLRSAARRGFLAWLERTQPDVLLLQEVRADASSLPSELHRPEGYATAWSFAEKKGYAGTGIWIRQAIPGVSGWEFVPGCGHPRADAEGRVTGARLHLQNGSHLDLWSLYLPSGSSGPERQAWKFEHLAHMQGWLRERLESGRPQVVGGDWNIAHTPRDIKNAKSNEKNSGFLPEERAWVTARLAEGWRDAFRELHPERTAYSWWSNRGNARANDVGWRIDYLFVSPHVAVQTADIDRSADLSDHAPVSVAIDATAK